MRLFLPLTKIAFHGIVLRQWLGGVMRGWWAIAGVILLAGCQLADKKSTPKPTPDDKYAKERHWLDDAKPDWAEGDVPKANSWTNPKDPKFDYTSSVRGALAGYVLDLGEKPAPNCFISIEPVDVANKTKPMVVLADANGSFVVHGLKPNQPYSLTAKSREGGMMFIGQTVATPPSVQVRIRLKEQMNLPSAPGFGQTDTKTPIASKPPAISPNGDLPPLPGVAPLERDQSIPASVPKMPSGDWSPTGPRGGGGPGDTLPMPGAARPDWTPPTVDVPSATTPMPTPTIPVPPLNSTSKKAAVSLLDSSGRPAEFPHGLQGELVLLDFMTSTCMPCKKAIPDLIEFQRRYGANGVELIGVLCDQATPEERIKLAGKYASEHQLNYLIYTEAKAGAIQKQFQVKSYPTLVLLNSEGTVLWSGHPKELKALEAIVRKQLDR